MNLKKERKTMNTETKQTTRTGTESQKWRSHGGLSVGMRGGRKGEKVQGIRSINGRYKIDRGRLRIGNGGNGEAKECIGMTHGHELRGGMLVGGWVQDGGRIKGRKNGTTIIA